MDLIETKHPPLTTQIARLARAPVGQGETEFRWEWDEIAEACLLVARDAARMANLTENAWNDMMARILADEADDLAIGGQRKPLTDDGSATTFADRVANGEWVVQE